MSKSGILPFLIGLNKKKLIAGPEIGLVAALFLFKKPIECHQGGLDGPNLFIYLFISKLSSFLKYLLTIHLLPKGLYGLFL